MNKKQIINDLRDLYNNNKLSERDECIILNTLEYLGFDISMI